MELVSLNSCVVGDKIRMQALDLASFQAFPPSSFDQTRLAQTYMHDATILSIMS